MPSRAGDTAARGECCNPATPPTLVRLKAPRHLTRVEDERRKQASPPWVCCRRHPIDLPAGGYSCVIVGHLDNPGRYALTLETARAAASALAEPPAAEDHAAGRVAGRGLSEAPVSEMSAPEEVENGGCARPALEVVSLRCRFFPLVGLAVDHTQLTAVA